MSGASVAAASVMSTIALPEMRRHGYSEQLAAGAVGIGATLDILIPPSIAMVIYGIATQTSIGKLLIAGVVPGIIVGIFLALAIFVWVCIRPQDAPETYRVSSAERWASVLRIWPSLLLILMVIDSSLHRGRHPNRSGCHRCLYGCSHWCRLWPSHLVRGYGCPENDHSHLGHDLYDPHRCDHLWLPIWP